MPDATIENAGDVCIRNETRDSAQVVLEIHSEERPHRDPCSRSCAQKPPQAANRLAGLQRLHQKAWRHSLPDHSFPQTGL